MTRNNLVPTPVVNKNGVHTTVYKKPVRIGVIKETLPPPAIGSAVIDQRAKNIFEVASKVREEAEKMFSMSDDDFDGLVADLKTYPDDLLDRLVKADAAGVPNMGMVKRVVLVGGGQHKTSEALHFYPMLTNSTHYLATKKVESLHCYPQLPDSKDYSTEPEEIRGKATALFRLIDFMHDTDQGEFKESDGYMLVFRDDRMTELALDHYRRIDDIIELMTERDVVDPDVIRSMLEADAPALGKGIL